ncbi:MAG: hypothetical protein ACK5U8_12635, partial [Deltaproteobacteria bacterium]
RYATLDECEEAHATCTPPEGIDPNLYSSATCRGTARTPDGRCYDERNFQDAPEFCCWRDCYFGDTEERTEIPSECRPQRATIVGTCEGSRGFILWDGVRCYEPSEGCECQGPECGRYATLDECEEAHATCTPPEGIDPNLYSSATCRGTARTPDGRCYDER